MTFAPVGRSDLEQMQFGTDRLCAVTAKNSSLVGGPAIELERLKRHPHWQMCGIPEVLYTDNGSDFKSKHIEQVAVDLKIQLVFSTPGKPQGRGRIERFFRTVNEMFLCELDGFGKKRRRKPNLSIEQFEELSATL